MTEIQKLTKEVDDVLVAAETKINTLAFSCGQELGDYDRLQSLARYAATIRNIRVGIAESPKPIQHAQVGVGIAGLTTTSQRPQHVQVTCPSFRVESGALVFRNLQRSGRGVYTFRVPKEQYATIVKAFAGVLEKGRYISTPKLIEACGNVPAYLPRVVIAMMKKMKVTTGPRGLVMFQGNNLESMMLNKWNELMGPTLET